MDEFVIISTEELGQRLDQIHQQDPSNRENLYTLGILNELLYVKDYEKVMIFKYRPQRIFYGRRDDEGNYTTFNFKGTPEFISEGNLNGSAGLARMEYLQRAVYFY